MPISLIDGCLRLLPKPDVVPSFAKKLGAVAVVTDMSPLRDPMRWAREVAEDLTEAGDGMPLFQVLKTDAWVRGIVDRVAC